MRKFVLLSLCSIVLILSCGNPNNRRKQSANYPPDGYNLMQLFELTDLQYMQGKTELIDYRSYEEGQEWARKDRNMSSGKISKKAEELFTSHYGYPAGMTDNESDEFVYERLRDDYVRCFSEGYESIISGN